jgi:peptidoglycan/LPS O-acetylase OafA/YrhL
MKYSNLEILRFVSALAVVAFHSVGGLIARGIDVDPLLSHHGIGAEGVDIFFVISGFVIYRGVLISRRRPLAFLLNRFRRILPSYWILTIVAIAITATIEAIGRDSGLRSLSWGWVISSFTFTSAQSGYPSPVLYQGWSLEYEMLFYVAIAIALNLRNKFLVGAVPGAFLVFLVLASNISPRVLEFVIGMVLAWLTITYRLNKVFGYLAISLGLPLLLVPDLAGLTGSLSDISTGLGAAFIVLSAVVLPQSKSISLYGLGAASYSVYLIQWITVPLFVAAFESFARGGEFQIYAVLVLTLVGTQVAGMLFNRFVDKPVANRLRRYSS